MQNHRITTKPRDTTDDIEVWAIRNYGKKSWSADKIDQCDFFMNYSVYLGGEFRVVSDFNDCKYKDAIGVRVRDRSRIEWVRKVFDVIDWREHAHKGMQGNLNLSKSDVVRGYEKYCDAYCWQID